MVVEMFLCFYRKMSLFSRDDTWKDGEVKRPDDRNWFAKKKEIKRDG